MSTQKTYLDSAGLTALWDKIKTGFAPRWAAYKPGVSTGQNSIDTIDMDTTTEKGSISFISAGILVSGGVEYGKDIVVNIPGAVAPSASDSGSAGLMSAADKKKLDDLSDTTENAVTIKGIHVGNGDGVVLNTDNNKFAHFNFVYNTNTKSLDITDRNNNDTVVATVPINDFTEDLAISGWLSDVDIVSEKPTSGSQTGGTGNVGPWLKLTFNLQKDNGSTEQETVYTSVADLISTYNAGVGIELGSLSGTDIDDNSTVATIHLKPATTTERGGIKVVEVTTGTNNYVIGSTGTTIRHESANNRNFGVEINTNDVAFVNVPIGNLTTADEIAVGDQTIDVKEGASSNTVQTFKIISGLTVNKDTDEQGHSITYKTKDISILPETSLTVTKSSTKDTTEKYNESATEKHELGTFNVVSSITHSSDKNGHAVTYKTKDVTIYETELSLGTSVEASTSGDSFISSAGHITGGKTDENENITISGGNTFTYLHDVTVNDHTITKTFKKVVISTPTIPSSVIESLTYPTI